VLNPSTRWRCPLKRDETRSITPGVSILNFLNGISSISRILLFFVKGILIYILMEFIFSNYILFYLIYINLVFINFIYYLFIIYLLFIYYYFYPFIVIVIYLDIDISFTTLFSWETLLMSFSFSHLLRFLLFCLFFFFFQLLGSCERENSRRNRREQRKKRKLTLGI